MPVVAFAKAKSWGLSTALLAVAGWWPPERRLMVAELDPAGGDLAARYGLSVEPGLVSLAAAARRELSEDMVWHHGQRLPGDVAALLGPASAEQAHAALGALAGRFMSVMGTSGADVLADCGRLGPHSPSEEVVHQAALAVVVARPSAEEIAHLSSRIAALRPVCRRLGVVLVGERPYRPDEVAAAVEAEVIGVLADDPKGAALLAGHTEAPWAFRRSALMRSAREVSAAIQALLTPAASPLPSAAPAPGRPHGAPTPRARV